MRTTTTTPPPLATTAVGAAPDASGPPFRRGGRLDRLAVRIEDETPADRDRVVDAVRVGCMLAVMVGHWLIAVVARTPDGAVSAGNLLALAPTSQWLTYGFQVMGLFFAVTGYAAAAVLDRRGPAGFVASRLRRLVGPCVGLVVVWALLGTALAGVGGPVTAGLRMAGVHLWFVAVLALLTLVTVPLLRLWRAHGWLVPAAAALGATLVDLAARAGGLPVLGWANFVLVWSVPLLLGFAWRDGLLSRRRATLLLVGGSLLLLAAVASPWLPSSLVGVPGAAQSNNSPPSVALVGLSCAHLGLVVLAAPRLRRLLARPRVWAVVVLANLAAVEVYLWHLTGMVLVLGAGLLAPSVLGEGPDTLGWWVSRPLWISAYAVVTGVLVAAARRLPVDLGDGGPGRPATVLAATATVLGTAGLATVGFGAGAPTWAAVAAVVIAACALRTGRTPRTTRTSPVPSTAAERPTIGPVR